MYVRDPHRVLFKIQKFDRNKKLEDEEYRKKAMNGIKYDHLLNQRPEFQEYLQIMHIKYLRRIELHESSVFGEEGPLATELRES